MHQSRSTPPALRQLFDCSHVKVVVTILACGIVLVTVFAFRQPLFERRVSPVPTCGFLQRTTLGCSVDN